MVFVLVCKPDQADLLSRHVETKAEKGSQPKDLAFSKVSSSEVKYASFNRLKRPEDFQRAFSSGQRSADKQFLFIVRTNNLDYARLGLAVPKKHVHKAVERNRIKRVIRESFRHRKQKMLGLDLVVLIRRPVKKLNQNRFDFILDKNWEKISKCAPLS